MSHGCVDIRIGATYSNDLGPRYVEHRRVTGMDGGFVQYEITHGKRTGATGACTPPAFWCWQRLLVADADAAQPPLLLLLPVFLDPICNNGWRLGPNSHLFVEPGTSLDVLHRFAQRIGLKRKWFQHKPGKLPHYDVTASRRQMAVCLGATELTREQAVAIWRRWRRETADHAE